jgi:iron complex transport system substrate-binding protein
VDGSAAAQVEVLSRVAPVEVLPWLTVAEVLASVARLGELVDADAGPLRARLEAGLAPAGGGPRLAVLLAGPELEGGGPFWFIKAGSLHGTAIAAAGFSHAIDPGWTGPPQIAVEGLIAADPEVVVVLSAADAGTADETALLGAVRALPLAASGAGRAFLLEGAHLMSVGPSILTLVEALRDLRAEVGR